MTSRRVGATMLANLTNQAVVIISQIAVVPILITAWGVAGFGTWIVLSAVPTYLGLSDFGLSISAKSDMAIRMCREDVEGAAQTLSSVLAIAVLASGAFSSVYLAITLALDWTTTFSLHTISEHDAKLVLLLGLVQIVFYQAFLFAATIIRATGHPAVEGFLSALGRGAEILALAASAWFGGSIVGAAAAWACARAALSIAIWCVVYARFSELRPAFRLVRWERIKFLLAPSAAYAMMPLAQSLFIQGTTLVVSSFAGPAVTAIFNTTRIIARLGVQVGNTINNTYVPYYSYAIGRGGSMLVILREHLSLLLVGVVGYVLFIVLFGEMFFDIVSKWQMPFDNGLFILMVASVSAEMAFGAAIAFGSAANRVGYLAVIYAMLSMLTVAACYLLRGFGGLLAVGTLLLLANIAMLAASLVQLRAFVPFGARNDTTL
ncbi:hypothetical protein [Bradyrhizobium yuanmingense]|uniref:hypothetical protein n=1 Tax=Bradyrhizobium yuanmingense TaxID=108015 RepID=UPI0012FE6DC4|nr:hypothetical protein [Bradyrhizobium yuanmingense]